MYFCFIANKNPKTPSANRFQKSPGLENALLYIKNFEDLVQIEKTAHKMCSLSIFHHRS